MQDFETLLAGSAKAHGHLCPGQVVGVRMAMLGCDLIGLDEPSTLPPNKKDHCLYRDGPLRHGQRSPMSPGVKLGRRSLKFVDNGIMAATFVNLETGQAYRIISRETSRDKAEAYAPGISERHRRQLEAYKAMPLEELFMVQKVKVAGAGP